MLRRLLLLFGLIAMAAISTQAQCDIQGTFYVNQNLTWLNLGAFNHAYALLGTGNGFGSTTPGGNVAFVTPSANPATYTARLYRFGGGGTSQIAGLRLTGKSNGQIATTWSLFAVQSNGVTTLYFDSESNFVRYGWLVSQIGSYSLGTFTPIYLQFQTSGTVNNINALYSLDGTNYVSLGTALLGAGSFTSVGLFSASGDTGSNLNGALFTSLNFAGNTSPSFTDGDVYTVGAAGSGTSSLSTIQFNPSQTSFKVVPFIVNVTCTPTQLAQLQSELNAIQASVALQENVSLTVNDYGEAWQNYVGNRANGFPVGCPQPYCTFNLGNSYIFSGVINTTPQYYYSGVGTGYLWYAGSVIFSTPVVVAYPGPQTF